MPRHKLEVIKLPIIATVSVKTRTCLGRFPNFNRTRLTCKVSICRLLIAAKIDDPQKLVAESCGDNVKNRSPTSQIGNQRHE